MFASVARRFLFLDSVNIFSMLDLVSVANKNLLEVLEPLVICGTEHIENCIVICKFLF